MLVYVNARMDYKRKKKQRFLSKQIVSACIDSVKNDRYFFFLYLIQVWARCVRVISVLNGRAKPLYFNWDRFQPVHLPTDHTLHVCAIHGLSNANEWAYRARTFLLLHYYYIFHSTTRFIHDLPISNCIHVRLFSLLFEIIVTANTCAIATAATVVACAADDAFLSSERVFFETRNKKATERNRERERERSRKKDEKTN